MTGDAHVFVLEVEALLAARRADPRGLNREFTREALTDVAYGSYKALLSGRLRHPPRRAVVAEVAAYLGCTLAERQRLLLAAGYAPDAPLPGSAVMEAALADARELLHGWALPALVLEHSWAIHDVNAPLLALLGVTRADFSALAPGARHLLRLLFDPALPLRGRFVPAGWEVAARRDLLAFRRSTAAWQYEDWHRALVAELWGLPDFARLWEQADADDLPGVEQARHAVIMRLAEGQEVSLQLLSVLLGDLPYPRLMAFRMEAHRKILPSLAALPGA